MRKHKYINEDTSPLHKKIINTTEDDVFDELRRLMKSFPLSNKILKKFNIFSILIGAISFFVFGLIFGSIGLVSGIIAKKDKQKGAIFGIILAVLSISLLVILWIIEDISAGNYKTLTMAIVFTIISVVIKLAGWR